MEKTKPKPDEVLDAISSVTGTPVHELIHGRSREWPACHHRQIAAYMLRYACELLVAEVGRIMERHPPTISKNCRAASGLLRTDRNAQSIYAKALAKLHGRGRVCIVSPFDELAPADEYEPPRPKYARPPMKAYAAKQRPCLRCQTVFRSSWEGERICSTCKKTNTYQSANSAMI